MVATADLWVSNAEHFCVSFFNQVTSIFHLWGGGESKKSFFGPSYYTGMKICNRANSKSSCWLVWGGGYGDQKYSSRDSLLITLDEFLSTHCTKNLRVSLTLSGYWFWDFAGWSPHSATCITLLLLFFQPPENGKLCGGKYLLNTYQLSTIKIY